MLFNSLSYIYWFLPISVIVFLLLRSRNTDKANRLSLYWLLACSLFFYGWWEASLLILLGASILVNYLLSLRINPERKSNNGRKTLLIIGIIFNLGLLGYYKYANFFINNINELFDTSWNSLNIILPLAISFFTFQQVAFLVDSYKGLVKRGNFLEYCLFVSFFPQLVAGPIVHHKEMMPQFASLRAPTRSTISSNLQIGLSVIALGLFKKVVIADHLAMIADPLFTASAEGVTLTWLEAMLATTAFTLQIYFDFSGYSDIAIGSARLFGIKLPENFFSPYKATSITDFWRRWHRTLSRFLRDYIYIALGGNRKGELKRNINLFTTMLIGGLWHGANWNFVIWGGLHGLMLLINHSWRNLMARLFGREDIVPAFIAWPLTLLCVSLSWIFFRASSFDSAIAIFQSLLDSPSLEYHSRHLSRINGDFSAVLFNAAGLSELAAAYFWIALATIVCCLPNLSQVFKQQEICLETYPGIKTSRISWRPNTRFALLCGIMLAITIVYVAQPQQFIYFQF